MYGGPRGDHNKKDSLSNVEELNVGGEIGQNDLGKMNGNRTT